MQPVFRLAFLTFTLFGCAANGPARSAPTPAATEAYSQGALVSTTANPKRASAFPEAVRALQDERLSGAMALFDTRDGKLLCSDPARCERGYSPASTFKIANAIIGFETGVLSDPDTPMPWNGKAYSVPDWNRDHTVRSAIQVSCVPCFQSVARQIGESRMRDWVMRLDYGNLHVSGEIDGFWLTGGLRISPYQEIDFLRRLDGGQLPISERTLDMVRDVLTLDVGSDYVLRGKTGWNEPPEEPSFVGWFVGFVELGERRVFFATVIDDYGAGVDIQPVRRRVTERVLRELGDLPG